MRYLAGPKPEGVRLVGAVRLQDGKRLRPSCQKDLNKKPRIAVIQIEFGRQSLTNLVAFGLGPVDGNLLVERHELRLAKVGPAANTGLDPRADGFDLGADGGEIGLLDGNHLFGPPQQKRQAHKLMASFAHHPKGVDPRRLVGQRARLCAVAALPPVDKGVAKRDLAVIDVVLFTVVEFAGVRSGLADLPLLRGFRRAEY